MKKIIGLVSVVAVMFTLAYAGENYFHTIKAEIGGFATGLGVGMSEPAAGYALDVVGAARLTGATTLTGSVTASDSVQGATVLATGLFQLPQVSSTALVSLVPGREGAAVWNTTRKTVCVSTSAFAKSWMKISTGTLDEAPNITCIE